MASCKASQKEQKCQYTVFKARGKSSSHLLQAWRLYCLPRGVHRQHLFDK